MKTHNEPPPEMGFDRAIAGLIERIEDCREFAAVGELIDGLDRVLTSGQTLGRPQHDRVAIATAMLDRCAALLLDGLGRGVVALPARFIELPRIVGDLAPACIRTKAWDDVIAALERARQDRGSILSELLVALASEGLQLGSSQALCRLIARLGELDLSKMLTGAGATGPQIGSLLNAAGWFSNSSPEVEAAMAAMVQRQLARDPSRIGQFIAEAVEMFCFRVEAPLPWLYVVLRTLAVAALRLAGAHAAFAGFALSFEKRIYNIILKKEETAENFQRHYDIVGPLLATAGATLGRSRPSPVTIAPRPDSPPIVAFLLLGDFSTAHANALFMLLNGLARQQPRLIEPLVYVFEGDGPNFELLRHSVEGAQVDIRRPGPDVRSTADQILWLRDQGRRDGLAAMVFVSVTRIMCFAAGVPVAPVRIWWTLKYHGLRLAEIEGYVAQGLFGHHPAKLGPHWRVSDVSYPQLFDASKTVLAAGIAAALSDKGRRVLIGCLGRAEKLVSRDYVAALADILRACPDALYLYTGRDQRPEFLDLIAAAGIADRCRYIGWVDTQVYAQVLDIQVDTFPFASGVTSAQVMAAGRPVVTLITTESVESSPATYFVPLYRGEIGLPEDRALIHGLFDGLDSRPAFPFVDMIPAYVDLSIRLIESPTLRQRVGDACRVIVEKYLRDEDRMAASFGAAVREIIRDAAARPHSSGTSPSAPSAAGL